MAKAGLVIGAGIAGIQAALDLADQGFKVYLVDKNPSVGGRMAQLDKTFPTMDCSACILTPKMVDVARHSNIKLLTYSEVKEVSASAGGFKVKILKKPRYVNEEKCTGCGECIKQCPVTMPNEFDMNLGTRNAIYRPFPQAVPGIFTIDKREIPPCRATCPAGVNVQGYVSLITQRKFKEALELIRRDIPFPAVCGRICFHPCEAECERGKVDEPLAINALKRFIVDYELKLKKEKIEPIPKVLEEKIAIIGSGPAGLTAAYELVKKGYPVTVFESLPEPGGMLRVGIPQYRLPKEILDAEIDYIRSLGVEIKTNTLVGKEVTFDELSRQGYKAIFIAIGAQKCGKLGIEGEELKGVIHALDFLRETNLGKKVWLGDRVAVIGGGDTAVDAARTALRLGAKEVFILYRRSREEMPAFSEEVEQAEKEGVKIHFLTVPRKILGKEGKATASECIRMKLGPPDESGRRRPIPIEGSEYIMELDTIIPAIGQLPDVSSLPKGVEVDRRNTIVTDPVTLETSLPGIFAGGDAVSGPATVIEAIAAGKKAAVSIDRYVRGEDLRAGRGEEVKRVELVPKEDIERKARQVMPILPLDKRTGNFKEVQLGFNEDMAMKEAERCLFCGGCSECLECEKLCEAEAIDHQQQPEEIDIKVGAIIVATGYDLFDARKKEEYGYSVHENVITGLMLERLLSASGPTAGHVVRPSDGKMPRKVAFVQCVGSRDEKTGNLYCSRICCMYATKEAQLIKEHVPEVEITIFYMDIRAFGKGFEEFYRRAEKEYNVRYVKGRVAEILENPVNKNLLIRAENVESGELVEEEVDMVVLSTGIVPAATDGMEKMLPIPVGDDGFLVTAHPKVDPVTTCVKGVFIAGAAEGPKDIPDSVIQASAAAMKASIILKE